MAKVGPSLGFGELPQTAQLQCCDFLFLGCFDLRFQDFVRRRWVVRPSSSGRCGSGTRHTFHARGSEGPVQGDLFWLKAISCSRWALLSFSFVDAQGMEFSPMGGSRWCVWAATTFSSLAFGGTQCVSPRCATSRPLWMSQAGSDRAIVLTLSLSLEEASVCRAHQGHSPPRVGQAGRMGW